MTTIACGQTENLFNNKNRNQKENSFMKYKAKYYPLNNKKPEHRRHDMSDKMWDKLAPLLPEHMSKGGRPPVDSRTFVDAVFLVLRTGAPCPLIIAIGALSLKDFADG